MNTEILLGVGMFTAIIMVLVTVILMAIKITVTSTIIMAVNMPTPNRISVFMRPAFLSCYLDCSKTRPFRPLFLFSLFSTLHLLFIR